MEMQIVYSVIATCHKYTKLLTLVMTILQSISSISAMPCWWRCDLPPEMSISKTFETSEMQPRGCPQNMILREWSWSYHVVIPRMTSCCCVQHNCCTASLYSMDDVQHDCVQHNCVQHNCVMIAIWQQRQSLTSLDPYSTTYFTTLTPMDRHVVYSMIATWPQQCYCW